MTPAGQRLLVFLKAPRPGAVKTRLAATLGAEAACAAYRELVAALLTNLRSLREVELHFTPADALAEIEPWLGKDWRACPQTDGDLGARLKNAFANAFAKGAQRVVIIGSDCPTVTTDDIEQAWAALRTHDVVLGPATDGGYWLIGLRAPQPSLFAGISWSSERVFAETMALATSAGLSIHRLREQSDVDEVEAWRRWLAGGTAALRAA